MSVDKYVKFLRSTKPKYMASHPKTGEVLYKGNTKKIFYENRDNYYAKNPPSEESVVIKSKFDPDTGEKIN